MKDIWKKIGVGFCVAMLVTGVATLTMSFFVDRKGKSAFEIAQEKYGYETEEEWLASLKGQDGKDAQQI